MPSERMGLAEVGIPDGVAYDFDLAVMALASTIDMRARETEQVTVPNGPKPPEGQHFEQRPKYTLRELLIERSTDDPDDGDDVFAELEVAGL